MGVILQKEKNDTMIKLEKKPLCVTNWKLIRPDDNGMLIFINNLSFYVYDLTFDKLNDINLNNKRTFYRYEYISSTLSCSNCGGTGKIDWVEKATQRKRAKHRMKLVPYIRDQKGLLKVLSYHGHEAISSSVKLKTGEEHCYECLGCGLHLNQYNNSGKTIISDS